MGCGVPPRAHPFPWENPLLAPALPRLAGKGSPRRHVRLHVLCVLDIQRLEFFNDLGSPGRQRGKGKPEPV